MLWQPVVASQQQKFNRILLTDSLNTISYSYIKKLYTDCYSVPPIRMVATVWSHGARETAMPGPSALVSSCLMHKGMHCSFRTLETSPKPWPRCQLFACAGVRAGEHCMEAFHGSCYQVFVPFCCEVNAIMCCDFSQCNEPF